MAKNWNVAESVDVLKTGSVEDKMDLGRRFPLFSILAAQVNEPAAELLRNIPEYITVRKVETILKGEVQERAEGEEEDEEVEAPKKEKAAPAKEKSKGKKEEKDEYAGKSAKELFTLAKERGLKVKPKLTAEQYAEALKKEDAKAKAKATEEDEDEDWDDEEEEAPKKPAKGVKGKAKSADEDEDWDI